MATIEERYISLLTDFGFKRIFGTAPNRVMGTGTLVHSLGSMNLSPMILLCPYAYQYPPSFRCRRMPAQSGRHGIQAYAGRGVITLNHHKFEFYGNLF